MLGQELGNRPAIQVMLPHTNPKRFHSPQYEPAFERGEYCAGGFLDESQLFRLLGRGADYNSS